MQILVSSVFQQAGEQAGTFVRNAEPEVVVGHDIGGHPIEFTVDVTGTSGSRDGVEFVLPEYVATIRSTRQLRLVLAAHDLDTGSTAGHVRFKVRPLGTVDGPSVSFPSFGTEETRMADCAAVSCGTVGCAAAGSGGSGCGAAGSGGGGCGAAGCGAVGCAAAGCAAVGCATVGCAAAGRGGGGCAAAGCGAVGCAAAGCAAAACGAVGCAAAGCAAVACGAASGACGAAACALDALCGANAGWPP